MRISDWSSDVCSSDLINNNTDICELEARFYHESANMPALPAARCYYADWDGDGSGQGVVVLEDLADAGGKFGHSTDVIGIDGVAKALEGLRSEEHTSELQSLMRISYAVFCLKKKTTTKQ